MRYLRFLLHEFAADFNGTLPLMEVEPMLDLLAGAEDLVYAASRGWDYVRLGEDFDNVAERSL